MNERERQLIEGIINTGDRRIHNRCIQLLFHGQDTAGRDERVKYEKNPYVVAIENAVRTNFSGRHYQGLFSETYMVFESLFTTYLEHLKPEKLREIDDLKNWLFVAAGRFCNSNRNKINELLGIEISDNNEEYNDSSKVKDKNDVALQEEKFIPKIDAFGIHIKSPNDDDKSEPSDNSTEQADSSDWAESFLNHYIDKINNAYYRDLIRAIKLEGVSVETMAEDYEKSPDDIYRDYNRAWDKLLQVTLPDIRIRSKSLFKKYESKLNDKQTCLLNQFFFGDLNHAAIVHPNKKSHDDMERAIVKAYKVLLRTAKNETDLDEKEKRKEAREQHRLEIEKATRKKTGNRLEFKKNKSSNKW